MTIEHRIHTGRDADLIRTDRAADAVRRDSLRLQRGVHVHPATDLSPVDHIRAAVMRAGPGAVVAGTSAAIMHGTRFIETDTVELIRDLKGQGRRIDGVSILRTDRLNPCDIQVISGLPVTNPVRTAYDLGRRGPDWKAMGRLDDLACVTGLDVMQLWAYVRDHPRARGVCQMRELIKHIDSKAESPGESWLRLLMAKGGLPRPESQVEIFAPDGRVLARLDLCYRHLKIDIEYDGVEFHTSLEDRAKMAARDRLLGNLGWEVVHVTGEKMSTDPDRVIADIEEVRAIRERRFSL